MSRTRSVATIVLIGLLTATARSGEPSAAPDADFYLRPWPAVSAPFTQVVLSSELPETILSIPAKEGQPVKKGDVLLRFDDRIIKAQIEVAQKEADFEARIASAEETRQYYQKELDRLKLIQGDAEEGRFVREADMNLAAHNKEAARLDVVELERQKQLANARLRLLQARKDDYTVVSPIGGVVSHVYPEEGEMAQQGQPLVEVIDPRVIEVVANTMPEEHYAQVTRTKRAVVQFATTGKRRFPARVHVVSPYVESTSGTFTVKLLVEPDSDEVKPGMKCEITFLPGD